MPNYAGGYIWARVMRREITQVGPTTFAVRLDLSPMTQPCPADQAHAFIGTQEFDIYMMEISGVLTTPQDSGSLVGQDLGVTPYTTVSLTPGNGTSSILVALWIFDNEGDTDTGVTSSDLTAIDYDAPNHGNPGAAPEAVVGHKIITSASGSYAPVVVSSPSPFQEYGESRGWASSAAVFLASGGTPTVVQTKYQPGTGGGPTTLTLDSVPTAGNLLVAFLAARNSPGSLAASGAGWTSMDMIDAYRAGPSAHHRYGRLCYKKVCA